MAMCQTLAPTPGSVRPRGAGFVKEARIAEGIERTYRALGQTWMCKIVIKKIRANARCEGNINGAHIPHNLRSQERDVVRRKKGPV